MCVFVVQIHVGLSSEVGLTECLVVEVPARETAIVIFLILNIHYVHSIPLMGAWHASRNLRRVQGAPCLLLAL